jgi:hypothetical protein
MNPESIPFEKTEEAYGTYPDPQPDQYILTEEQKQILIDNDLVVNNPVPQSDFEGNIDWFRKRSNNFVLFFLNTGLGTEGYNFFSEIYQSQEVFKRFCLVRPDLVDQLLGKDMLKAEPDELAVFLEAYTVMTALVDEGDRGVTKPNKNGDNSDTEYFTWFLCQ